MTLLKKFFVSSLIAVLAGGTALGCSDPGDPGNQIGEVLIVGVNRTVGVGATVQFEGRAATTGGDRIDELITWTVSAPNIMGVTAELVVVSGNIVNRATVTGLAPGAADLIATAGTKSHSVRINVSSPPP